MKLHNLAIIFIIIILPMLIILSSYISAAEKTLGLQTEYDQKLHKSTYDAIKVFQMNTLSSSTSDLADSKIRDIKASVNIFYNSLKNNFAMNGYDEEDLQLHVPAIVYGMYDGYYIYSPYHNTCQNDGSYNEEGEIIFDLKPYVYYSRRYRVSDNTDVVITYSLDNYVTIRGKADGKIVDLKGYLLSSVKDEGNGNFGYRNVSNIGIENNISEKIVNNDNRSGVDVPCRKINGVKYYKIDGRYYVVANGKIEERLESSLPVAKDEIERNSNARDYYKQAYELKEAIYSNLALRNLSTIDAVDELGRHIGETDCAIPETQEYPIFEELFENDLNATQIEDKESMFYAHKMDVIKYCIERNLSVAISNFNDTSGTVGIQFEMPKLNGSDLDSISKNISVISFLQGLSIGGKMYNGYSVAVNNKNEEFVSEDAIYIETVDGSGNHIYHDVRDSDLINNGLSIVGGYFNTNYERKTVTYNPDEALSAYFYPREALGCYHSIVLQNNVANISIKDWLSQSGHEGLAKIYYTALGRERYGMYRVENAY